MLHDQASLQFLRTRRCFTYQCSVTTGAGPAVGTSFTTSVRVTDLDFVCTSIRASCRAVATGRAISADDDDGASEVGGRPDVPFLIALTETGSQRQLQDQAIDGLLIFDAQGCYDLPVPMLISAATQVQVQCTNLKVFVAAQILRLAFVGFHITAAG